MIIGQALKVLPENYLNSLTSQDIIKIFGSQEYQNEDKIKRYFAAKNFKELVKELDANKYDLNDVFYIFLNSCLEIIKVLEKPYYDSDMKKYKNLWSLSSVTLLFEEIYKQLDKLRNYSNYKEYDAMIYICSLLNFKLD